MSQTESEKNAILNTSDARGERGGPGRGDQAEIVWRDTFCAPPYARLVMVSNFVAVIMALVICVPLIWGMFFMTHLYFDPHG